MRGKRGLDSWDAIKWIPRFLIFTLCLILIMYIFGMLISVEYDARAVKAESAAALLVFSDVFSHPDDPSAISLERFVASRLEGIYPPDDEVVDDDSETIVRELRFAPISARLELSSIEGAFETRELFYEEETFARLREFYVSRERSSVRFVRSENLVRVIDPEDVSRTHLGLLTIEVLV